MGIASVQKKREVVSGRRGLPMEGLLYKKVHEENKSHAILLSIGRECVLCNCTQYPWIETPGR